MTLTITAHFKNNKQILLRFSFKQILLFTQKTSPLGVSLHILIVLYNIIYLKQIKMEANPKEPINGLAITSKGYSNLIFNEHKRGMSALSISSGQIPTKTRPSTRDHNILILRKNRRQNYQLPSHPTFRQKQKEKEKERQSKSVDLLRELYQNNKVNVINLMNCSMTVNGGPKLKSHYCKKITLTNVDKYYEFCLKKMKAICGNDGNLPKDVRDMDKGQERPLSSARRTRPNTPVKVVDREQNCGTPITNPDTPTRMNSPRVQQKAQQKPNISSQDLQYLQNSHSYIQPIKHPHHHPHQFDQHHRNHHSSFDVRDRNRGHRRYMNTSQIKRSDNAGAGRKNQFAIDAWESHEGGAVEDIF